MPKPSGPPVHDDLLRRRLTAERTNQLWLTDIAEHRTDKGKLHLCAIEDMNSCRVVGYSISDRITSPLRTRPFGTRSGSAAQLTRSRT